MVPRMERSFDSIISLLMGDGAQYPSLSVDDFLLTEEVSSGKVLSKTAKDWVKNYKHMFGRKGLQVADLQQNPTFRPRWGSTFFPTLTTGCTKIVNFNQKRVYSSDPISPECGVCGISALMTTWCWLWSALDLAAAHGMPVTRELANQLGCNKLEVDSISNSALCSCVSWLMFKCVPVKVWQFAIRQCNVCVWVFQDCAKVGNSMHMTCIGATLVAAVLTTSKM